MGTCLANAFDFHWVSGSGFRSRAGRLTDAPTYRPRRTVQARFRDSKISTRSTKHTRSRPMDTAAWESRQLY